MTSHTKFCRSLGCHFFSRLHIPVGPYAKALIRDCIRSIKRGLGPSTLKDLFDVSALRPHVVPGSEFELFSRDHLPSVINALLVASYFCMRELEIAAAAPTICTSETDWCTLLLLVHTTATSAA